MELRRFFKCLSYPKCPAQGKHINSSVPPGGCDIFHLWILSSVSSWMSKFYAPFYTLKNKFAQVTIMSLIGPDFLFTYYLPMTCENFECRIQRWQRFHHAYQFQTLGNDSVAKYFSTGHIALRVPSMSPGGRAEGENYINTELGSQLVEQGSHRDKQGWRSLLSEKQLRNCSELYIEKRF